MFSNDTVPCFFTVLDDKTLDSVRKGFLGVYKMNFDVLFSLTGKVSVSVQDKMVDLLAKAECYYRGVGVSDLERGKSFRDRVKHSFVAPRKDDKISCSAVLIREKPNRFGICSKCFVYCVGDKTFLYTTRAVLDAFEVDDVKKVTDRRVLSILRSCQKEFDRKLQVGLDVW